MDVWCAVEAAVPIKHSLKHGRYYYIVLDPWARGMLPLLPA
jgi:hypothetical protein